MQQEIIFFLFLCIFIIGVTAYADKLYMFMNVFQESLRPAINLEIKKYESHYGCYVPDWNKITLDDVPYSADLKKWSNMQIGVLRNMLDAEARLLSAFVYKDQISVITTSQHIENSKVTCRYYDCKREEIPNTMFNTIVVPMTVVTCPRRYGAEFMSLNFTADEKPHQPIPLIYRIYDAPVHELSVCVGPLYGNESKWLEIVEYVEHYKLMEVSHFYFTLFNLNEYDRKIVDYYEKMGYAEYTSYVTEYHRLSWMFHLIQTQECHHRSRFHSKWVLNIDIDERLTYTGIGTFLHYLRSMPESIVELSFPAKRVRKTGWLPEKLSNLTELPSEMLFLKYNETTETLWFNLKGVIRPESVFILFYHWSNRQVENAHVMSVPKRIAHIRHYRQVDNEGLNADQWSHYDRNLTSETRLDPGFERKLIDNVVTTVKYVYDQRWVRCEEIPETILQRFGRTLMDCLFKNETIIGNSNR